MSIPFTAYCIVCPLVFLSGFVDSIAGGGGLISLPAYLLAGLPAHQAIATNKLSSAIGTTASTARYLKNGCVSYRVAIPSVVLALIGSAIGTNLILMVPERYIQYLLLIILPLVAVLVLRRRPAAAADTQQMPRSRQVLLGTVCAFFIGMYDGFYGPGTGTFLLIMYTQLCHMPVEEASGTVKMVNLASNLMSMIVFLQKGQTLVVLGLVASVFSLLGHLIGSGMVMKNGTRIVRPIIIVVLALLFIKVISGLLGA